MNTRLGFLTLLFFTFYTAFSQHSAHLSGALEVDLNKNELKAQFELSELQVANAKMSFMLYEDYDVEQVYLNGAPIASSKNGRSCDGCKVYTIWIDRELTTQDTVTIALTGSLGVFEKSVIRNSTPRNRIYQTDTKNKWYPVVLEESTKKEHRPFAQNTYDYRYALKVIGKGFKDIRIAGNKENKPNTFTSEKAISNLSILLGRHPIEDFEISATSTTSK